MTERKVDEEVKDLFYLSTALTTAVDSHFMAPDHASIIWKKFLRGTSIDVVKTAPVVKE